MLGHGLFKDQGLLIAQRFADQYRGTLGAEQAEVAGKRRLFQLAGGQGGMAVGAYDANHGEAPLFLDDCIFVQLSGWRNTVCHPVFLESPANPRHKVLTYG